jgi:NTP pyrophosphatase (non-canonical NTP hydrolase)
MKQVDLRELQAAHKEWSERNFPPSDQPSGRALFGLMEELGELAHAHLKQAQGIRCNEDHGANGRDAVGDIVIFLADYCTQRGWSLEECITETWAEVSSRDWVRYPDTGRPST